MEQPDDDVIWGSFLPENLGGARSRNQPITERPSADPGLGVENGETVDGKTVHDWFDNALAPSGVKLGRAVKSDGVVFLPFVETSSVMASGTGTCLVL